MTGMDVSVFIGRRIRFRNRIVVTSVAVSFLVMIIAVAVSSGFRNELRDGLSEMTGDIRLGLPSQNYLDAESPVSSKHSALPHISVMDEVEAVNPAIYRAGIVKAGEDIHGVLLKGVERNDSLALSVAVPESFAEKTGLGPGDDLMTYFIGEKMKARRFRIAEIYPSMIDVEGRFLIYADIDDMRRLNGWSDDQASVIEVMLTPENRDEHDMKSLESEIGFILNTYASEDDDTLISASAVSRFPKVFGWLELIDFNVFFVLLLMTVVAGFNMISGLLIMLFENISTIGLLKALGMTDKAISKVFLSSSAVLVFKGMLIGNITAAAFCFLQNATHLLKLDPENYFVPYVPVHLDIPMILTADITAFVVIMLLLLIPSMFISRVDPAQTVRVK